jgi:hypothetical protein
MFLFVFNNTASNNSNDSSGSFLSHLCNSWYDNIVIGIVTIWHNEYPVFLFSGHNHGMEAYINMCSFTLPGMIGIQCCWHRYEKKQQWYL